MSSSNESAPQQRSPAPSLRWAVTVAAVVVWLFVVVAAYFWAHKPFDADTVAGLGRSLLSIAVWIGITWLGAALGQWVTRGLLADESPAVRLALAAGLGLGLLSLLTLGLGLVGLLRPAIAWGLVLGLGVLLRRDLRASLVDLRGWVHDPTPLPWPTGCFQRWLAVYVSVSLVLTFLITLAPPTRPMSCGPT